MYQPTNVLRLYHSITLQTEIAGILTPTGELILILVVGMELPFRMLVAETILPLSVYETKQ